MHDFSDPTQSVVMRLEERNRIAAQVIQEYVTMHGGMDVAIGLVGLIPGAAIPALMVAISAQAPVIYQPLARRLATVYLAPPDDLASVESNIIVPWTVINSVADIAADFGGNFIADIAGELLMELGLGAAVSFIPIVGAFIAAGLDYKVATMMTNRVGRMVSIYFQNGAQWVGSKQETYEISKTLSSDLDSVRTISTVRATLLRSVRAFVRLMRNAMTLSQIRDALRKQEIPDDLIDEALGAS